MAIDDLIALIVATDNEDVKETGTSLVLLSLIPSPPL